MKKVALALALLSILAVNPVNATEFSIVGHGLSRHVSRQDFNERPYGAALRLENKDFGFQVGDYYNSIRKNTFYAGLDWSPIHYNVSGCVNIDAGLYVGGATGYKYTVTPMAGVQAAVKCENIFVRVRAMPDPFYNSKAVGAVEIGLVLKKF